MKELNAFCVRICEETGEAGDMSTWPRNAGDDPEWIGDCHHDNRRILSSIHGRHDARRGSRQEHVDLKPKQFGRQFRKERVAALRRSVLDNEVLPFNVAQCTQPLSQRIEIGGVRVKARRFQHAEAPDLAGWLSTRRPRPKLRHRSCRASKQRDELAPSHSITSSARARKASGTVSPMALATFKLTTNSNFVGACTGSSAGFSPRRMRST